MTMPSLICAEIAADLLHIIGPKCLHCGEPQQAAYASDGQPPRVGVLHYHRPMPLPAEARS